MSLRDHASHPSGRSARALAALLVVLTAGFASVSGAQQTFSIEQTRVLCQACHADKFEAVAATPHTVLDREDWQAQTGVGLSCINCHGDVSEHIAQGGQGPVFAFLEHTPVEQTAVCIGCHQATHPRFDSSPHARAGLTCTNCHSQHSSQAPFLLRLPPERPDLETLGPTTAICTTCHSDVVSEFTLNEHHRLTEGVLECTSCHDPHEPATRTLLGGFQRESCTTCHGDKGGPFVFEHPVSRVEGCTTCHSPHGSPNRHLLKNQRVAELCLTCHAEVPQFHLGFSPAGPTRFSLDTQCTTCHSAIHGSNFNPDFLR